MGSCLPICSELVRQFGGDYFRFTFPTPTIFSTTTPTMDAATHATVQSTPDDQVCATNGGAATVSKDAAVADTIESPIPVPTPMKAQKRRAPAPSAASTAAPPAQEIRRGRAASAARGPAGDIAGAVVRRARIQLSDDDVIDDDGAAQVGGPAHCHGIIDGRAVLTAFAPARAVPAAASRAAAPSAGQPGDQAVGAAAGAMPGESPGPNEASRCYVRLTFNENDNFKTSGGQWDKVYRSWFMAFDADKNPINWYGTPAPKLASYIGRPTIEVAELQACRIRYASRQESAVQVGSYTGTLAWAGDTHNMIELRAAASAIYRRIQFLDEMAPRTGRY